MLETGTDKLLSDKYKEVGGLQGLSQSAKKAAIKARATKKEKQGLLLCAPRRPLSALPRFRLLLPTISHSQPLSSHRHPPSPFFPQFVTLLLPPFYTFLLPATRSTWLKITLLLCPRAPPQPVYGPRRGHIFRETYFCSNKPLFVAAKIIYHICKYTTMAAFIPKQSPKLEPRLEH